MRILLDTHVVLWVLSGTHSIGGDAEQALVAADEVHFSVVSFVEIGIKQSIGKLSVPSDLQDRLRERGLRTLGLAPEHGLAIGELPTHHRDPFDRLLIAQARAEGLVLLSADRIFRRYDVPVIDATR